MPRIEYISSFCLDKQHLLWYPLLSTLALLTLGQLFSYWAFWGKLFFDSLKSRAKEGFEDQRLLTVSQSIALRQEIAKQQSEFNKIIEDRDLEIDQLNKALQNSVPIQDLDEQQLEKLELSSNDDEENDIQQEAETRPNKQSISHKDVDAIHQQNDLAHINALAMQINLSNDLKRTHRQINLSMRTSVPITGKVKTSEKVLQWFVNEDLLVIDEKGFAHWTDLGKEVSKILSDMQ